MADSVILIIVVGLVYLIIGFGFVLHYIFKNAKTEKEFNEMVKEIGWSGYFISIFLALCLWPYVLYIKYAMQKVREFSKELNSYE